MIQQALLVIGLARNGAVQGYEALGMGQSSGVDLVALVDEVLDVCLDPPDCIADETHPHVRIEARQRFDQTHVALLDDFKRPVAKVKIRLGDLHDKPQVGGNDHLPCVNFALPVPASQVELFFRCEEGVVLDLSGVVLEIRRRISAPHRPSRKWDKILYYLSFTKVKGILMLKSPAAKHNESKKLYAINYNSLKSNCTQ